MEDTNDAVSPGEVAIWFRQAMKDHFTLLASHYQQAIDDCPEITKSASFGRVISEAARMVGDASSVWGWLEKLDERLREKARKAEAML